MSFYPVTPPDVTPGLAEGAGPGLLGRAGMVAVRVADLARSSPGTRKALTAAGAGKIAAGDVVVWLKPVAVTAAVVRRDGRVQAAGHPAEHARLGVAESRLDALTGIPDVIGQIAAKTELKGKVQGKVRRAMTPALTIRLTLLMTLMGGADYAEVLEALIGDLALVPWQRTYRVPTPTVLSAWRDAVGPVPLEQLRDLLLAGIDAEHREHECRAVTVGSWTRARLTGR